MLALLAVLIGGAIGTAARLGLDDLFAGVNATFPVSTLIINVVGSLILGFLVARVWPTAPAWLRAGVGPGILGGFTTFSAFSLDVALMIERRAYGQAAAYSLASVVVSVVALFAGLMLMRRIFA